MRRIFYTLLLLGATSIGVNAQYISITSQSTVYTEDFNTLSTTGTLQTTLPSGWWIAEFPGNFTYQAGTGSASNGDTWSFGSASNTDRAFGGLASGSVVPNFGVRYINNSGSSFSSFYINCYMEQWRAGASRTTLDSLYFFYAVNGNNDSLGFVKILNGTWTRYSSADMVSKVTNGTTTALALDGNTAANRQYYGFYVSGVTVNVGDTLYLRWRDPNAAGNDDGLALDDYSFSVTTPVPVTYTSFTANKQASGSNLLKWSTASESNNSHFEIQRSLDGKSFESIARVKGNGTTSKVHSYNYSDLTAPAAKVVYYRLKQVDFDGKSELSKMVSVVTAGTQNAIQTTLPNPFADNLSIGITASSNGLAQVELIDMIGKVHYNSEVTLSTGNNTININAIDVPNGIYFVRVSINGETFTRKVVKK